MVKQPIVLRSTLLRTVLFLGIAVTALLLANASKRLDGDAGVHGQAQAQLALP